MKLSVSVHFFAVIVKTTIIEKNYKLRTTPAARYIKAVTSAKHFVLKGSTFSEILMIKCKILNWPFADDIASIVSCLIPPKRLGMQHSFFLPFPFTRKATIRNVRVIEVCVKHAMVANASFQ